jgi:hypothetical protein
MMVAVEEEDSNNSKGDNKTTTMMATMRKQKATINPHDGNQKQRREAVVAYNIGGSGGRG